MKKIVEFILFLFKREDNIFLNLTPHNITIVTKGHNRQVILDIPSKGIARVKIREKLNHVVSINDNDIKIKQTKYEIVGVPTNIDKWKYIIVSEITKMAINDLNWNQEVKNKFIYPDKVKKDKNGKIIGTTSFLM